MNTRCYHNIIVVVSQQGQSLVYKIINSPKYNNTHKKINGIISVNIDKIIVILLQRYLHTGSVSYFIQLKRRLKLQFNWASFKTKQIMVFIKIIQEDCEWCFFGRAWNNNAGEFRIQAPEFLKKVNNINIYKLYWKPIITVCRNKKKIYILIIFSVIFCRNKYLRSSHWVLFPVINEMKYLPTANIMLITLSYAIQAKCN